MRNLYVGRDVSIPMIFLVVDIVCLLLLFVIYNGYQADQLCRHLWLLLVTKVINFAAVQNVITEVHFVIIGPVVIGCVVEDLNNPKCWVLISFAWIYVNDASCKNGTNNFLQGLSMYHMEDNAINRILMGINPHGIFVCAVINVVHTVQHGVILILSVHLQCWCIFHILHIGYYPATAYVASSTFFTRNHYRTAVRYCTVLSWRRYYLHYSD